MTLLSSNTVKQCRPLLGTFVEIKVIHPSVQFAQKAIHAAFCSIETVQKIMSFHHANSDLSHINRIAQYHATAVHPWLYAVLKRAQQVHLLSQGLFDCTVASTLVDWQYLPSPSTISSVLLSKKNRHATQTDVMLLPNFKVQYKQPLWLDLGGIAKGFAIDIAVHMLRQHGIAQASINAGGDLRVFGQSDHSIEIRHPAHPQQLIPLGQLQNGACATSAVYYSKKIQIGQDNIAVDVSALVNPFDNSSVCKPHSYTVIAPNATIADALTKVLALSENPNHLCLQAFGAVGYVLTA